jgi:hypothetical protein
MLRHSFRLCRCSANVQPALAVARLAWALRSMKDTRQVRPLHERSAVVLDRCTPSRLPTRKRAIAA